MLTYVAYVYAATNCDKLSDHPIMRSLLTVRSSFHSWGKSDSCRVAMVVFEQSTKPFTTLQRAVSPACWAG